jgi:hypothetical protein
LQTQIAKRATAIDACTNDKNGIVCQNILTL